MTQARQVSKSGVAYGALRSEGFTTASFPASYTVSTNLTNIASVTANGLTAAANRITITTAGVYVCNYWVSLVNSTGADRTVRCAVGKNGDAQGLPAEAYATIVSAKYQPLCISAMDDFVAGDYIEVFHSTIGGPNTMDIIDEHLNVVRVG